MSAATPTPSLPPSAPPRPLVGVAVLLIDRANHPGCILVGERKGSHGAKTFATPGGHLEYGEEWNECATREIKEETNLDLLQPIKHVATTNDVFPEVTKHYITLFLRAEVDPNGGKLQLMEPEKCKEWVWMPWEDLKKHAISGEINTFRPLMSLIKDANFKLE